jgi:hypothetical protein
MSLEGHGGLAAGGGRGRAGPGGAPAARRGPGIRAERLAQLENTPGPRRDAPGWEEGRSALYLLR